MWAAFPISTLSAFPKWAADHWFEDTLQVAGFSRILTTIGARSREELRRGGYVLRPGDLLFGWLQDWATISGSGRHRVHGVVHREGPNPAEAELRDPDAILHVLAVEDHRDLVSFKVSCLILQASARAMRSFDGDVGPGVFAPREMIDALVCLRDAALQEGRRQGRTYLEVRRIPAAK